MLVRPDVAAWRRERLPELPDGAVPIAPDWACEILSPGREDHDIVAKAALYLREGVRHSWLVDPESGVLECREHGGARWHVVGAWGRGALARIPPFDAVEIAVEALFVPRPRTDRA